MITRFVVNFAIESSSKLLQFNKMSDGLNNYLQFDLGDYSKEC